MAETVIRINRRTLERTIFLLIIVALAVMLFVRWDASTTAVPDQTVTDLEEENQALQAQLDDVRAQLEEAEREIEVMQEASDERAQAIDDDAPEEPEPVQEDEDEGLSGVLEFDMQTRTNSDDKLDLVTLVAENGLDNTLSVSFTLYWEEFGSSSAVRVRDTFVVTSGDNQVLTIDPQNEGFLTDPTPGEPDVLMIDFRDEDGDLLDRLEETVG